MDSFSCLLTERHKGVQGVEFSRNIGATSESVSTWESENQPYSLPDDLKAFLSISNGLTLQWALEFRTDTLPVGKMHVNAVEDLVRVPLVTHNGDDKDEVEQLVRRLRPHTDLESTLPSSGMAVQCPIAAFNIDKTCKVGKVVLLYNRGPTHPQVWLIDLGCSWHYVANSFTDYFRVMIMHLGLPNWQYVFTPHGLDPPSRAWMQFFSPAKLKSHIESVGQQDPSKLAGEKADPLLLALTQRKSKEKKKKTRVLRRKGSFVSKKGTDASSSEGGRRVHGRKTKLKRKKSKHLKDDSASTGTR
eukprot:TRINITY_DN2152_c0_g1_i1.p1 TRINITY_DN2152_c0_g1~~TRINITY_DN2152_c0_g1_i1.p1  ORF type:complete len:302 (-),score=65.34 TRINITY_DN2152_c0_g1_i1:792-1697(-)